MKLILRTACIKSLIVSTRDACTREDNVKLPALWAPSISTAVYFIYKYIAERVSAQNNTQRRSDELLWNPAWCCPSALATLKFTISRQHIVRRQLRQYGTSMQWSVPSSRGGLEENQEISNTRSASPFWTPSRRSHASALLRVKRR